MKRLLARIGGPQYRMQGNWSLLTMLRFTSASPCVNFLLSNWS